MTAARKIEQKPRAKTLRGHGPGIPKGHGMAWRQWTRERETLALDARRLHHALERMRILIESGEAPTTEVALAIVAQCCEFCALVRREAERTLP